MLSIELNIPELRGLYIEDFYIEIDIYKNLRCKLLVKSTNYEVGDIVSILKMYSKITIILNGVYLLYVTPGSARVEDEERLEIQFFGHIANLYKEYGYYAPNGNGLVDFTIIDPNTQQAVGCFPIILLNDILKNTDFKIAYAPSITNDGRIDTDNRIFIRGEWLNKAEWVYEIAKNCFFYEFVQTDSANAITGSIVPDFITAHRDNANSGALVDCCNVMFDAAGNITIGVAGCQYIGNNCWKKLITNITPYVLSQDDTVFNFVEFDNAVVLGSEPGDDSKKRTYLAKPLTLEMHEVFANDFNRENYEFTGLSKAQDDYVWQIVDDQYNQYLECEMWRSGSKNFRVYDFATIKNLICKFGPINTFSVDIANTDSAEPQTPTLEGYTTILGPQQRYRAGMFIGGDEYNKKWEDGDYSNYWMRGYFFFLEQVNENGVEKVYMRLRSGMNMFPIADSGTNTMHPALDLGDLIEVRDYQIMSSMLPEGSRLCDGFRLSLTITPEYSNDRIVALTFRMSATRRPTREVTEAVSRVSTTDVKRYLSKHNGRVGLYTAGHLNNFIYEGVDAMEDEPFVTRIKFDNFQITTQSESLYGQVNKPIIMNRDRSVNVNEQGQLVALALYNQRNNQKDIKVKVNPSLFFERGIVPGQWVQIDYPHDFAGEYRICTINIGPDEVELCLNHSDMRYVDQMDGVKKYLDALDSF